MKELIFETTGTDKIALLTYAIVNKYQIVFHYNGVNVADPTKPNYTKKGLRYYVQPVALGRSNKSQRMMFRGWQTGGVTNTEIPKWKTFIIDEIAGSINVWDGAYGSGWKPFTNQVTEPGEEFNQLTDGSMIGSPAIVNDEMRADITVAEKEVASGKILVMDESQDGGPNLNLLLPKEDKPEVSVVPMEPKMSVKDKRLEREAKEAQKKADALKNRLIQKTKRDNDKLDKLKPISDVVDDDNSIDNSIIPVNLDDKNIDNHNPNNINKNGTPPEQSVNPEEEPVPEEDPLKESSGWLQWIEKLL